MRYTIKITLSGADKINVVRSLLAWSKIPDTEPDRLAVDYVDIDAGADLRGSLEQIISNENTFFIGWQNRSYSLSSLLSKPRAAVVCNLCEPTLSLGEIIETSSMWPFELLVTGDSLAIRRDKVLKAKQRAIQRGFGDGHCPHGHMCAFRGSAHERLVSRRWLEHGPWRVIRNEEQDTTYIQFHDFDADPEVALEQAAAGYERMGISDTGGFIQSRFYSMYEWNGFYIPEDKQLRILITDREVSQDEMLEACALRHYQHLGEDKPLERISYVFFDPEAAHRHLHELWLRELECYTFDSSGNPIRLDDTYQPPPPVKPQWVIDLEAREAQQGITWFED